jgi:type 1 glutamine amidotransferase
MRVGRTLIALLVAVAATQAACSSGDRARAVRAPAARFRVLVFTKATRYRHASIPVAVATLRRLGHEHGFAVDDTADERRFTDGELARYRAVVFVSTTGVPLARASHRAAFRRYIRRGGGFLGIHAASASMYRWRWWVGLLGASFRRHAPGTRPAEVVVQDRRSAATRDLPARWRRVDEWYAFRANPRGHVHVLAVLDERTYHPQGAAAMGPDHPIAWCHRYAGGRSVYTALGNTSASFREPLFVAHLLGAVEMAAGRAPFDCRAG